MSFQPTDDDIDVGRTRGYDAPVGSRRWTFTETKLGFKTTEFWVMIVVVAGILISTYADDDTLAREDGWRFVTFVVAAYLVSRGLAKLGSREPYVDNRRDDR
jgi:hypothetical protein